MRGVDYAEFKQSLEINRLQALARTSRDPVYIRAVESKIQAIREKTLKVKAYFQKVSA